MEPHFKCECHSVFASMAMLKKHGLTCPLFINYDYNCNQNRYPAQIANHNYSQSPAAANFNRGNHNGYQPKKQIKCIFDSNIITDANKSVYHNVCSNQSCIKEYNIKCNKKLNCGHDCMGSIKDRCLDCLDVKCNEYINYYDQNLMSYCPICLTDTLKTYSVVQLNCNHFLHRKCILKRLELKWTTEDVNFNYLNCPVCSKSIIIETIDNNIKDEEILAIIKEDNFLFQKIKIITEKMNQNEKEDIPLEKYAFYLCAKCSYPFCSGLKDCREELEIDEKSMRLCSDCYDYSSIKGITNCEIHGRKHIQYKCKFCCNLSSHFCFGTTHFCEDCHLQQMKGIYVTSKTKDELPKCNDINTCPLKVKHPSNGEEFAMYCLLCLK
jgi:hypothetical protein